MIQASKRAEALHDRPHAMAAALLAGTLSTVLAKLTAGENF